jgi:tRNA-Thr(GGU) m(6)t(6)A37 methyltransferase TsaA
MSQSFFINSIGVVRKTDDAARIEIFDEYADGLLGLEGFSHMMVFYWFDQNDTPLTGVFATHSPLRPNLIALTRCKIVAITKNRIDIEEIDAHDGSPVIDIKCYVPASVEDKDVRLPDWIKQKTDDRRQKTDDRGQKTEDRKQMTDDRKQRTENR